MLRTQTRLIRWKRDNGGVSLCALISPCNNVEVRMLIHYRAKRKFTRTICSATALGLVLSSSIAISAFAASPDEKSDSTSSYLNSLPTDTLTPEPGKTSEDAIKNPKQPLTFKSFKTEFIVSIFVVWNSKNQIRNSLIKNSNVNILFLIHFFQKIQHTHQYNSDLFIW